MDQVMRENQKATAKIKIKEEECFHSRRATTKTGKLRIRKRSGKERKIIGSNQREATTIVAPSNCDSTIELNSRKWIFKEEKMVANLIESNSRSGRSNKLDCERHFRSRSSGERFDTMPRVDDTTPNLSLKMEAPIEVSENYRVIQNRRQQIDCPGKKIEAFTLTKRRGHSQTSSSSNNLEFKLDEEEREGEKLIPVRDYFLKMPSKRFSSSFDCRLRHTKQVRTETWNRSKCLLKIGSFSSVKEAAAAKRRSEIGVVDKIASYLFLTLLIIIARELYTQTRCDSTSNHLLNDQTPASTLISQRCLSDLVLIRSCFAASTLTAAAATTITDTNTSNTITTRPENETLQALNVTFEEAGVTMTEAQQITPATFGKASPDLSLKNTTTDAATLAEGNNNNSNNRTTIDSSNTTNHRHQIHQSQLSVLCNSRCNCVMLEPLFGKSANQMGAAVGKPPPAGIRATTREEIASSTTESALANSTGAAAAATTTGSYSSEQALIAFNEDYSLDYEQPLSSPEQKLTAVTTTPRPITSTMNGSESNNDDPSLASTSVAGNDRGYVINNNNGVLSSPQTTKFDGGTDSRSSFQLGNSISASSITNQTSNNNNSSSNDITITVSNMPVNFTTSVTTADNIANLSDVANSGSSRQSQPPIQAKQSTSIANNITNQQLNKQTITAISSQQQQGMTLFPLPSPHLHLHHHHHHGAGAGRDSSGPQLYAQSLYSSQAPKLSYHAHTPYLKASPSQTSNSNLNTGQQQQQQQQQLFLQPIPTTNQNSFNTGDKIYQDTSILNTFSLNPSASSNPLTPGGGSQNAPLQYHHMRSNYVAHHLRLQQQHQSSGLTSSNSLINGNNNLPIDSNNFIASKSNHVFPQQFILVPLKTMNMSQKLKFCSSQQRNNTSETSFNNNNTTTTTNDINDYYQDFESNWKDCPDLIEKIELMLNDIDENQIQSLILSKNELQFELWSELYALLAIQMRSHLFHLDLSHNSLIKLGITFTGYIEHHIVAHNGWPIQQQQPANGNQSDAGFTGTKLSNPSIKATKTGKNSITRMRHSLFSGGKLYNLIKVKRQQTSLQSQHHYNTSNLLQQALLIKALDLSHNKLKWLIKDQFRALKHVQTIRLDYNRIRYIHQHAFSGLESLRFLNLNFNRLQVIYIEQFQTNYNLLVSICAQ